MLNHYMALTTVKIIIKTVIGGYGRRGYGRSFGRPGFFGRGRRHHGRGLGGLGRVIGPGLIIGGAAFGGALIGAGLAQNGFGK